MHLSAQVLSYQSQGLPWKVWLSTLACVCLCLSLCVYVCLCVFIFVCMCLCLSVCVILFCVFLFVCICLCLSVCVFYVVLFVCVFLYVSVVMVKNLGAGGVSMQIKNHLAKSKANWVSNIPWTLDFTQKYSKCQFWLKGNSISWGSLLSSQGLIVCDPLSHTLWTS